MAWVLLILLVAILGWAIVQQLFFSIAGGWLDSNERSFRADFRQTGFVAIGKSHWAIGLGLNWWAYNKESGETYKLALSADRLFLNGTKNPGAIKCRWRRVVWLSQTADEPVV